MAGRPVRSEIRENIAEILFYLKKAYGYQLHKHYNSIFEPCTRESIYYHLKKGQQLGIFELAEIRSEKGTFSWGGTVEKNYFILGPNAELKFKQEVHTYFNAQPDMHTQKSE